LGVKELWLIDEVNESVEIRTLDGERYPVGIVFENGDQIRSAILPALAFDVRRIFAD
jgi:Uma2 family endonuclease